MTVQKNDHQEMVKILLQPIGVSLMNFSLFLCEISSSGFANDGHIFYYLPSFLTPTSKNSSPCFHSLLPSPAEKNFGHSGTPTSCKDTLILARSTRKFLLPFSVQQDIFQVKEQLMRRFLSFSSHSPKEFNL